MGLEFLAVLQRPQPAQPRQLARRQRLARQQVRILQQAQQQARRQVRRWQDQPLRTPQKGGEHTRVRPPQPEPQRSKRVKQLLRAFPSEPLNERRVRNKSRQSQLRQVVAAKPERDLKVRPKLSELQLKERPRARKQRDQLGSGHEVAKPRVHRNDHKNNQFGRTVSVKHYGKSARHMSVGLFCTPKMGTMSFFLLRRLYRLEGISRPKAM